MKRRAFTAGFGALLTGASLAGSTQAGIGEALTQGDHRPVRLRFGLGGFQTINAIDLGDGSRSVGLRWTAGAPVFDERRFDLSGLGGGIGGLFRTPFATRWARAHPIGTVEHLRGRLIVRVEATGSMAGARVTLGAGDFSWDLPATLTPQAAMQGTGAVVGALRVDGDGRLLVALSAEPVL